MRDSRQSIGLVAGNDEEEGLKKSGCRRRGRRSSGGGDEGGPCGACKFLRRKCVRGCMFAPYFGADEEGREGFSAVHKVFGASNVSKLLQRIPHPDQRRHALITLQYQAHARLLDPIYGCLRTIFALKRQVENLQAELEFVRAELMGSQQEMLPTHGLLLLQHDQVQMNGYEPPSIDTEYQKQLIHNSCIKTDGDYNLIDKSMSLNYSSATLTRDQFLEPPPFSDVLSSQADSRVQRLNLFEFLVAQDFAHELHHDQGGYS